MVSLNEHIFKTGSFLLLVFYEQRKLGLTQEDTPVTKVKLQISQSSLVLNPCLFSYL